MMKRVRDLLCQADVALRDYGRRRAAPEWAAAIDRFLEFAATEDPLYLKFIREYWFPRAKSRVCARSTLLNFSIENPVSESTLYQWREQALLGVFLLYALELEGKKAWCSIA